MVHAKLIIRALFGIIGNFTSVSMFASSMPTFYGAIKNKSVEEIKPDYYLLTTMNCLLWVLYSTPFVHPGKILVLTANGIGLVIHLAYLIIFLLYVKDHQQRRCIGGVFLIELAVICLVSGLVIGLAHTVVLRTIFVGSFCCVSGVMMYLPRFSFLVNVCRKRNVEYMPFLVVLRNTLNDLCWLIYGSLRFDINLLFTHVYGFSLGVVQLVVHGINYTRTSGDDKKLATAEVQLEGIGIGDDMKIATNDEVRVNRALAHLMIS